MKTLTSAPWNFSEAEAAALLVGLSYGEAARRVRIAVANAFQLKEQGKLRRANGYIADSIRKDYRIIEGASSSAEAPSAPRLTLPPDINPADFFEAFLEHSGVRPAARANILARLQKSPAAVSEFIPFVIKRLQHRGDVAAVPSHN